MVPDLFHLGYPQHKKIMDLCPKQSMLFPNTNVRLSLPKVKASLWHGGHFAYHNKSTKVPVS